MKKKKVYFSLIGKIPWGRQSRANTIVPVLSGNKVPFATPLPSVLWLMVEDDFSSTHLIHSTGQEKESSAPSFLNKTSRKYHTLWIHIFGHNLVHFKILLQITLGNIIFQLDTLPLKYIQSSCSKEEGVNRH